MIMVEVITYIAAGLLKVVEPSRMLEYDLINAVTRLATTFAKFLFVGFFRISWIPLLYNSYKSLNAMVVDLRLTRGST